MADKEYVRQLTMIFKRVGLEIDGIVPIALAERNLMLDSNELYDSVFSQRKMLQIQDYL